ncbi:hypothetical protein J3R30DRAFT_3579761 [Lentinula aciculospora]|uniref:BTB domain-containing protein n=1 Tax=Lentinula aciculospora TaxID=153920 RepID=A0A9W9DFT7_9AGAR|nr:hypothetical protein J3R30DRAFT_3579761 [Lentinula aciculospora]
MSPINVQSNTSPKYVQTTTMNGMCPDLVLKSSNSICFHVHTHVLNSASSNNFKGLAVASNGSIINLTEDSQVLIVILDIIYRSTSAAVDFSPPFSFDILAAAISCLPVYGIDIQAQLDSDRFDTDADVHPLPIFQALHAHATTHALELYILAAQHNMEALAVVASAHLVGFQLVELTDEQAELMGPRFLRRLMLMQTQREEALKRILLQTPYPHPTTPECDALDQKTLTRAWTLTAAYFAWDIQADLPSVALERLLGPLAGHVSCEQCKRSIREQVARIVFEWEAVKGTI